MLSFGRGEKMKDQLPSVSFATDSTAVRHFEFRHEFLVSHPNYLASTFTDDLELVAGEVVEVEVELVRGTRLASASPAQTNEQTSTVRMNRTDLFIALVPPGREHSIPTSETRSSDFIDLSAKTG